MSSHDVDSLTAMGFPAERAKLALQKKKTVQEALEYLLADLDAPPAPAPVPGPAPAAKGPQSPRGGQSSPSTSVSLPQRPSYAAVTGVGGAPTSAAPPSQDGARPQPVAAEAYFVASKLPPPVMGLPPAAPSSLAASGSREDEDYERAVKQSLAETAGRDATGDPLDPNERVRAAGLPTGLKNVGNTCYFNSMVHIYYMLPAFRNAILRMPWREPSYHDDRNVSMVLHLQKLFALMTRTDRKYLDPTSVLKIMFDASGKNSKLGTQEDPTEFNLLFLNLVRKGTKKLDPEAHSRIKDLFRGTQLQRVVSKEKDGERTEVTSKEKIGQIIVDLKPDRAQTLYTCLDEFTIPTEIEDYVTPKGFTARATRTVCFETLPPVLTVQIQRAFYDREGKRFVKLNTPFSVDPLIYLDRYLDSNSAETMKRRQKVEQLQAEMRRQEDALEGLLNYKGQKVSLEAHLRAVSDYLGDEQRKLTDGAAPLGMMKKRQQLSSALELLASQLVECMQQAQVLQRSIESLRAQRDGAFVDMNRVGYRLHAVLVHDGQSIGSGHYWAYLYDREHARWVQFDDTNVSIVSEADVLALREPERRVLDRGQAAEDRPRPTTYCLVYLSEKMLQQAHPRAEDCVAPSLAAQVEADNRAFADELRAWNEAKAAGRNPDPLARQVDDFKARFLARLDGCIADVNPGAAHARDQAAEPRLRSFAHYLLSLNSQDLLQYVLAQDVWRELFPEKSFSSSSSRSSELFRKLEVELGQVPWSLSFAQEGQLRDLRADFKAFVQLGAWFASGLEDLNQDRFFEAVVFLLYAYKRDKPSRKFLQLGEYTRVCILGISRTLWQQLDAGEYANAIDQGWKLAALVIDDFTQTDPLVTVLKREWTRRCDTLETRARTEPQAIAIDQVRRIREMYRYHSTRSYSAIRLTDPERLPEGAVPSAIHDRLVTALAAAAANPRLSDLRRMLDRP